MPPVFSSLREALGYPVASAPVPTKRSKTWLWAVKVIEGFARADGVMGGRSAAWLWQQLHCSMAPRCFSWGELLGAWGDTDAEVFRARLLACPSAARLALWSWNVRWMVDLGADRARAKQQRINDALLGGFVVCLQETHWLLHEAELWLRGLITSHSYHSPAAPGNRDDRAVAHSGRSDRYGGVAILLPPGFDFIPGERYELVPGHVIAAKITDPNGDRHQVVCCYLRPGDAHTTWAHMLAQIPDGWVGHPDTVWIGDFNTDLMGPDCQDDLVGHGNARPDFSGAGVVLHTGLPTCDNRNGHRTLDGAVVAGDAAGQWTLTQHWTGLSDHAVICAHRSPSGPLTPHRACTPARFWALPQEGRAQLRGRMELIAQALGVPRQREPNVPPAERTVQREGCNEATDPIWALAMDEDDQPRRAPADGIDGGATEIADWNPLLAAWGMSFFNACFQEWWSKWRRRSPQSDPIAAELREIATRPATGGDPVEPSEQLRQWLASVEGPEQITADDARRWLNVLVQLQLTQRRSWLPRSRAGPTIDREPPTRATCAGRAVRRQRGAAQQVQLPDGAMLTNPRDVAGALLDTRDEIWFFQPPGLADSEVWIGAYCHGREHGIPQRPPVDLRKLRGSVQAPAGSGVGDDGVPYEALQLHPQLVACILAQGFYVLDRVGNAALSTAVDPASGRTNLLDRVLGPARELLLWIRKELGNLLVTAQRPLNLPRCIRRLFGAAGMQCIGPGLEPGLDPGQAAVAGGSCHRNIRQAFAHLRQRPDEAPADRFAYCDWACRVLFGDATDAVLAACRQVHLMAPDALRRMAACFLLDQARAFEMITHEWLRRVYTGWKLPGWAAAFLISMAEGRRLVGNPMPEAPGRQLWRGVGMGGPASLLTWGVGFDPVAWIAQLAAGCNNITYVDDLLAKVFGPGQTLLAYLALLAATHRAGLRVEDHGCVSAAGTAGGARAAVALACFPAVTDVHEDGSFRLTNGPVETYVDILVAMGVVARNDITLQKERCKCKTKHGLIPLANTRAWAEALEGTPLGAAVTVGTRFLGGHLCGRCRAHEDQDGVAMTAAAFCCFRLMTWKRAVLKIADRVTELLRAGLALHSRAAAWNTYCVSTCPYPASIVAAGKDQRDAALTALARLFPCVPWARRSFPWDLGLLLGLRGSPRDPSLVADTATVMALIRGQFAGPPEALADAERKIRRIWEWAGRAFESDQAYFGTHSLRAEERAHRTLAAARTDHGGFNRNPRLARAVHIALWSLGPRRQAHQYLQRRSGRRRWGGQDGTEWDILANAERWADAYLAARVYLGGVPGTAAARRRPRRTESTQDSCHSCGAGRPHRWRWLSAGVTRGSQQEAVGWCVDCCAGGHHGIVEGDSGPNLGDPDDSGIGARWRDVVLGGPLVPRCGVYSPCPLCHAGEAGSEHVAVFCPAVRRAWRLLAPAGSTWRLDVQQPGLSVQHKKLIVQFNRGIGFLTCTLARAPAPSIEAAVRLLILQVSQRNPESLDARCGLALAGDGDDVPDPDNLNAWEWPGARRPNVTCDGCGMLASSRPRVRTYFGAHGQRRAGASSDRAGATLQTTDRVDAGRTLFALHAATVPAVWPVRPEAVFGQTLTGRDADHNMGWRSFRCDCGTHWLVAQASRRIEAGALLVGPRPPNTAALPAPGGMLLSFDGGARRGIGEARLEAGEDPVAGAGALLWSEPDVDGRRRLLARAWVAAPAFRNSMLAEAVGLATGISLIRCFLGFPRPITVLGDNLPLLRLAAATGRLRTDGIWAVVEAALMYVAAHGWNVDWVAVRRHRNCAADAAATDGVRDALRAGVSSPTVARVWLSAEGASRGWVLPTRLPFLDATVLRGQAPPGAN